MFVSDLHQMIEKKIRYDQRIEEHHCVTLKKDRNSLVLLHEIEEGFSMVANGQTMTVPKGSYTTAYYWVDRPYNLYLWRSQEGQMIGAYFNIVQNTIFRENEVSFEDLIIDLLVFPDGSQVVLDEEELPTALPYFLDGFVQKALHLLIDSIEEIKVQVKKEITTTFTHARCRQFLKQRTSS